MKKRIGIAAGIVIVLALLAAGVFMYLNSAINSKLTEGKIMDGVECDGVDLGGMTKAEAEKALEKHISIQERQFLYINRYHHLQRKMVMNWQDLTKMGRQSRPMEEESVRYPRLCIMPLSVRN